MALYDDVYSISTPRTGDARVYGLSLTGWGNALATWSEQGRMYWTVTTGNVFDLYRNEAKASGDKLATGTIASGSAPLAAANSSGITGSVKVAHTSGTEATGEVIISYADEPDLKKQMQFVTTLLDGSSLWEGVARFEGALQTTKVDLDNTLIAKLGNRFQKKTTQELNLADIAKPRQLAEVHALLTCALLERNRATNHPLSLDRARDYEHLASEKIKSVALTLDFLNDDIVDETPSLSGGRITRG